MATSSWQQTESDNNTMPIYLSTPANTGPAPAVVVIQHQTGVDPFMQSIAQRLADAGFVAAAPDLYHRDGPNCQDDARTRSQRLSDRRVVTDIGTTVEFLQRQSNVDGKRIGIIGFCMGGRIVYLAAAAHSSLKACVTFYPGNTGRPWGRDTPSPLERTQEIHCPVQGHFGNDDKNPSPEDRERLAAELAKHNKVHELFAYPGAGHAFMDDTKESYRPQAATEAWPRALAFLQRYLAA
jgi:carboxymethylenebutenolidase